MSYPPQPRPHQPNQPGGQQWGPAGQPSAPQPPWNQPPQQHLQAPHGQPGQQYGQQQYGPQQYGQRGQQQYGQQPQQPQQPGAWGSPQQWSAQPAPQKSKTPLLIGGGVALVVVIGLIVAFATGLFGGTKYVGDALPQLPASFGEWSKAPDSGGISLGDVYTNGRDEVSVIRDTSLSDEPLGDSGGGVKVEQVATGVECATSTNADEAKFINRACVLRYKQGWIMMLGMGSSVDDAAKAFAKHAR